MSLDAPAAVLAADAPRAAAYRALIHAVLMLERRVMPLWLAPAGPRDAFAREVRWRYTVNCLRELRDMARLWRRETPVEADDGAADDGQRWPDRFTAAEISAIARALWCAAHDARGWHGCIPLAATEMPRSTPPSVT